MGRWAQRQKRGGGGSQVLTTITLSTPDDVNLTWTVTGPMPAEFNLQISGDGNPPWNDYATLTNADQPYGPADTGFFYRITAGPPGSPSSQPSNTVLIP